MLGHHLLTVFRNLRRGGLYEAVCVAGLAVGLAAAILTGLFIRQELSFDHFIPGYRDIQVLVSRVRPPGRSEIVMDYSPEQVAPLLDEDYPGLARIARLVFDRAAVRQGDLEGDEQIAWVDPDFLSVLPLPVLAGDPGTALARPDAVIVTRAIARKYFGPSSPIGRTLLVKGQPMQVTAELKDLPAETHLTQRIFASGAAPASLLWRLEHPAGQAGAAVHPPGFDNSIYNPPPAPGPIVQPVRVRTYLHFAGPAQAATLRSSLAAFSVRHAKQMQVDASTRVRLGMTPLDRLHLYRFTGSAYGAGDAHGSLAALYALAAVAALVLLVAGVNFVNLMTARAGRRALEVGMRKTLGATRGALVVQFIGECLVYVAVAMLLAVAATELVLPVVDAELGRAIAFDYWRRPGLPIALAGLAVVLAVLAGLYPALVLSAFRPAAVLKGRRGGPAGSGPVRQALVTLQFAVLIGLVAATLVIERQTRFVLTEGMRLDTDQVLLVDLSPCRGAFADEVGKLPGVRAAACSSTGPLGLADSNEQVSGFDGLVSRPGCPDLKVSLGVTDFGFFELYGVKPLAGRLFSRAFASDELPPMKPGVQRSGSVVINASAARQLGFAEPGRAVGQTIVLGGGGGRGDPMRVIGVVPDVTVDLLHGPVTPTLHLVDFGSFPLGQVLNVKLDGRRAPETLAAVDRLWRRTGHENPIRRRFLDAYVRQVYASTLRQGALIGGLAAVAVLIAAIGLFAMAAFAAESRRREIGIRKVLGATRGDILRLLLAQFLKPVLLANLIAWPLAFVALRAWLSGFDRRIPLGPGAFVIAALLALAIAALTVVGQALRTARAEPARALRYE